VTMALSAGAASSGYVPIARKAFQQSLRDYPFAG